MEYALTGVMVDDTDNTEFKKRAKTTTLLGDDKVEKDALQVQQDTRKLSLKRR